MVMVPLMPSMQAVPLALITTKMILPHSADDGFDNDGDGWTDLDDPDCISSVIENSISTAFECNDGIDNDADGATDADDSDCANAYDNIEAESSNANCDDEADNDGDGWIDDEDPDCGWLDEEVGEETHSFATTSSTMTSDGLTDSEDPGCDSAFDSDETHTPECNDEIDNDGDGWTDLDDPICLLASTLYENDGYGTVVCNDGFDNEGDGWSTQTIQDVTPERTSMKPTHPLSAMMALIMTEMDGLILTTLFVKGLPQHWKMMDLIQAADHVMMESTMTSMASSMQMIHNVSSHKISTKRSKNFSQV